MPAVADKSMVFKIGARDDASVVFSRVATAASGLEKKLDDLDRKHAKPKVTLDSEAAQTRVTAFSQSLNAIENKRVRLDVDLVGSGGGAAPTEVGDLRRELGYLRDVKVKVRVDTGTSEEDLAALGAQMASFRNAAATLSIRIDAGTAEADMAALGAQMASFRDVSFDVDLRTDAALTKVAVLRARLEELRDVQIGVVVNSGDARAELTAIARAARRLNGLDGNTIRIKVEVDAGNSRAELTAIATLLREVRGTTRARVDVNTGNSASAIGSTSSALKNLKIAALAIGGPLAIPGLSSTVGQIGSLGASVMSLTGILGLLPAAGAIGAAGIATVAVGLQGFGDALKVRDDAEAFAEALENLSPAARAAAVAVRDLGPAWTGVRLDVQERLFAGLGDTINQVSSAYLPTMKAGLGAIATELNTGAKGFAAWATEGRTVADVNTILTSTRVTLAALAPAGVNVAAALTDIAVVGSSIMPELASGATLATARFREFVAAARDSGQLEEWIRGGISTLEQLGRIAGNTGGILGSVFSASEEAGYGFLDAVEQVTGELDTLLSSTAGRTALVDTFAESRDAVNTLLPGVRELTGATLATVGAFARTDGLEKFAGVVSQTASAVSPLVSELGELAGGTLGALAGGASLAVAALTPIASLAGGLVNGLGPVAPAVLAAVVAFKGLGLITPMLVALGARITATAALSSTLAAGLTGSLAAGTAAAAGMTRLGTAVGAVGRALPVVGIAAIGLGLALDSMSVSTDDAVAALAAGGVAADNMRAALLAQQGVSQQGRSGFDDWANSVNTWVNSNVFGIASIESSTEAMGQQRTELTAVQRAQQDASAAALEYQQAIDQHGASSEQAGAAARNLADATDRVEVEQRAAERAAMSYSDTLREQAASAQTAIGAGLQLEDALARVAQSHDAANEAAEQYGVGTEQANAANRQFVGDANAAAQAAADVAIAQAQAAGSADPAAAGTAAYGATLLQLAANADGPARAAILGTIAGMTDAQLAALSAGAAASGFATSVMQLPDGRTVTIAVDPETGEIISTQQLIENMPDGDVAINLETQAALTALQGLIGTVNASAGSVNIDGNPQAAGAALQTVLGAIAAGQATVTINGQDVPARAALGQILGQISASNATVTIGGQNVPAATALRTTLAAIDSGAGTVTIGGQSIPAQSALRAILGSVNGSNGTMTILGRDGGVAALQARLSVPTQSTHTVYVRQVGNVPGKGTQTINHDGNVIPASSTWFASGGTFPGRFQAGLAQKFPPRHLRWTGDRVDVDEYYLPDNSAPRSMSLGGQWASRRGLRLVPKALAAAMTDRRSSGPLPVATPVGAPGSFGPLAEQIRGVMAQIQVAMPSGGLGRADLAGMRSDIQGLAAKYETSLGELTRAVRSARGITVEDRSGDSGETARKLQMVLLTGQK